MDCTISISDDRNYIILKVIGEFTAENFMKFIIESHTLGNRTGIHRYLVDATEAKNIDSAFGNYKFAYHDMKATEGVDPLAIVAGLVSSEDHSHDFVETVSNNAGMFLKLFTDLSAARDYLLKKHPANSAADL